MPTITLTGLSKSYGPGAAAAVNALDLTIPDGAFMCLLGPSGCGKTTTLRMIAGLERPSAGEIAIGDRVLDAPATGRFVPAEKRNLGLVFQSYALWPHMTVEANTEFGLRMRKMPREARSERVREVLDMLQIGHLASRYPSQLSGGQQQRVALARMLAVRPSVLLLDEPLSNLDARLRLEMRAELKRIHDELRTTIVFVTHDQFEAMTLSTHVAVMHEGFLQQVGGPMDIYREPANLTVARFVGNPPMNLVSIADGADPLGWRAWLAEGRRIDPPRAGWIGVRPEGIAVRFADPGPADQRAWRAEATIESVLPTGPTFVVQVRIGDQQLYLESAQEVRGERGDAILLRIAEREFHVFDGEGFRVGRLEPELAGAQAAGVPA